MHFKLAHLVGTIIILLCGIRIAIDCYNNYQAMTSSTATWRVLVTMLPQRLEL